ncbi:MAG TPA: hypothetical protein VK604_08610 [Bryobacteraceae bacterium]|nr:hypothetical protein [Bryobacteraceae bacterium]
MVSAVGNINSRDTLSLTYSSSTSEPTPVIQSPSPSVPHRPTVSAGDVAYVSRASTLLSQVEHQLRRTPATGVNQVLSGAATDILAQAQAEHDPMQAQVLENLAARLQVAANSGPSALPPYSLALLLGG